MQEFNRNKSLIKRNILNYLAAKGISKYEFYKNSGMSRGTLDNTSGLTEENIVKFLSYAPAVNTDWLLFGKGEMLKNTTEYSESGEGNALFVNEPAQNYRAADIPLYDVRNAAAVRTLLENKAEFKPVSMLKIPGLGQCDGAIYVSGDTMYPLLKSNDIAVYKTLEDKENSLFWGEMYLLVIQVETEATSTIAYIQKSEKGSDYIALKSHNPQYDTKDIRLDQVLAFAQVKATVRVN